MLAVMAPFGTYRSTCTKLGRNISHSVLSENSAKLSGNNYHRIFALMRCVSYGKCFLVFSSYNTQHLNITCQDVIETKRDSLKASLFINVCVYWLK